MNKKLHQLQIDAACAQARDLAGESPSTSTPIRCEAVTLGELHTLLVRARVARGWSQRRLAAELGIAEQQIQCYEASGYANRSPPIRCRPGTTTTSTESTCVVAELFRRLRLCCLGSVWIVSFLRQVRR